MCRPCACDENPVTMADLTDLREQLEDKIRDLTDKIEQVS